MRNHSYGFQDVFLGGLCGVCPYSPDCLEEEFCELRILGILGSPYAGSWIRSRNTPPRWPRVGPIRARGGRYYLRLDAYASVWMAPADANSCPRHPARQK